jgi:hypothetical protein
MLMALRAQYIFIGARPWGVDANNVVASDALHR